MNELLQLPKLGFGFMRLPEKDNQIDYAALNAMVDEFMKNGFTYFDTAFYYHEGESEKALKSAVVDRYPRESYNIATKLPAWELTSKDDVQKIFDKQLARTGVGYFDYYLLHSVEAQHLKTYDKYDCWNWAKEMKEKGLIRHFGFSYHDSPELLDKVLTEHPEAEFVQLQINYLDWDSKIIYSGDCYDVARKHNKPVIIMEPVKGGMLASMKPELEVRLKSVEPSRSIASWAMRYCLSLEGVAVVLSGMSAMDQVIDNISTAKGFLPFSEQEKRCLDEVAKDLLSVPIIGCTGCRYCADGDGCPMNINICGIINAYNTVLTYGNHMRPHFYYSGIIDSSGKANSCIKCGKCESVCPQHLKIIEVLEKASELFDVQGMAGLND